MTQNVLNELFIYLQNPPFPPDGLTEYGMRRTHLQREQTYESGETLCGHEAHTVTRIAHAAQHRHHQQHDVGYNVHVQLLHHT